MSTISLVFATQQEPGLSGGAILFLIIVVGLLVVAARRSGSVTAADRSNLFLDQSPQESLDVVTGYLVQEGVAVAYRGETTATFTRPKKADTGLGCFLLLLGLIPGLLYFGLFKGTYTTTVTALRQSNGTQLILSGDDTATQRKLIQWSREHLGARRKD